MNATLQDQSRAAGEAAKITLEGLSQMTLGRQVTWEQLIELIHEADKVQVVFSIYRMELGEEKFACSAGSIECSKQAMLQRAREGIRWADEKSEKQGVRVSACAKTLWVGAS